jgi:FXSXX-COOH protein
VDHVTTLPDEISAEHVPDLRGTPLELLAVDPAAASVVSRVLQKMDESARVAVARFSSAI